MRSDTIRNRRRMVESARVLLGAHPNTATMADIAAHAEISTASAYRYFPTMDTLVATVVTDVIEDVSRFSRQCEASGESLLHETMLRWVDVVLEDGVILVQLRSRRGYLERYEAGDPVIRMTAEVWSRPVREFLGERCTPEALPRALMLLNQLSDPRDLRDLHTHGAATSEQIAATVIETFRVSVGVWLDKTRDVRLTPQGGASSREGDISA